MLRQLAFAILLDEEVAVETASEIRVLLALAGGSLKVSLAEQEL